MPEESLPISHSGAHVFVMSRSALVLRLTPASVPQGEEACVRLVSTEGPAYEQVLYAQEDSTLEEGMMELVFLGVFTEGKYSLEVDPGHGKKKYWVFQEKTFAELTGLNSPPPAGDSHGV